MQTCIKFRPSTGKSPIISTSLQKLAVIDRTWRPLPGEIQPAPNNEELWVVDVVRESSPGEARGCFVVRPIRRIAFAQADGVWDHPPLYLVPGTYQISIVTPTPGLGSVAIVTPDEADGRDWVLTLDAVQTIMSVKGTYALVVNLGGSPWRLSRTRPEIAPVPAKMVGGGR